MPKNPFRPYPKGKGPIKLFVYGEPKTEKTRRALRLPGPRFMIDMEKGADEYGDLAADGDQYMACASHSALVEALDYLDTLDPKAIGTVIIDPITTLWKALQAGMAEKLAEKEKKKGSKARWATPEEVIFDQGVWGRLNRSHDDIMTRLINAPYHVVFICRGKELKNDQGTVIGYGYDGHKSVEFLAKTIVQTHHDRDVVMGDRSGTWKKGDTKRLDFADLVANSGKGGARLETASEAARRDAADRPPEPHASWKAEETWFNGELEKLGMSLAYVEELCTSKGWPAPSHVEIDRRRKLLTWLASDEGRAAYKAIADAHDRENVVADTAAGAEAA